MVGKLILRSLLAAAVVLGFALSFGALPANGAALTWSGGGTNLNWSVQTNWSPVQSPVTNAITFTNSGAVADSSGTSSVVDSNNAITSLAFLNSGATNIQSISIPAATTLSVTGAGGVVSGGTAITVTNPVVFSGAGAFTVSNSAAPFILGPGSSGSGFATTMTMSALSTFSFTGSNFYVGWAQSSALRCTGGVLYLASTSSITTPLLDVGDSNGGNAGSASALYLSTGVNTINANSIDVGRSKQNGSLQFASTAAIAPIVTIRGSSGGANRATTFTIGDHASGSANVVGAVDFSSGQVNALIGTLTIGSYEGPNAGSGTGTFILGTNPNSIVDATTVAMASGGTNSAQSTGTLEILGGAFAFGTFPAPAFGTANVSFFGGTIASNTAGSTMAPGFSMSGAVAFGQLSGYTGTLAFSGAISLLNSTTVTTNVSTSYEGAISGGWPLTKAGPAPLTLSGSNTYTGDSTINGGNLVLNFAALSAPASNIINNQGNSSALNFGGGSLIIQGSAGANNSQQFNGVTVNSATAVSTISVTSGASGAASLSLGSISYSSGLMVFSLPASGSITTSTPDGVLGPWATVSGAGYAAISGGTITSAPVSDFTSVSVRGGSIPSGPSNNVAIVDGGSSGPVMLGSPTTVISTLLQSATGNAAMIALSGGTLQAGGLLVPSGAQALTIGASPGDGSLMAATPGGALALYSGTSGITVNSVIADNTSASGLYTFGPGSTVLVAANTYTGPTTVTGGTLVITGTGSLGNGSYPSSIINGGSLIFSTSAAQALSGPISGAGSLTQSGAGILTLSNSNTYIGTTNVSGGTLAVTGGSLAAGSAISIAGPGTMIFSTTSWSPIANTISGSGVMNVFPTGTAAGGINFSGNLSGFSGTMNVNPFSTGGGKTQLGSANYPSSSAVINVLNLSGSGGTLYVAGGGTLTSAINLYGGTTGEQIGQLRDENSNVGGPVTLYNNSTVGANGGGNIGTISGSIGQNGGSYGITKQGTGTIVLSGSNNFTGVTSVSAGTLTLANTAALAFSTFAPGGGGALSFGALTSATLGGLQGTSGTLALNSSSPSAVALSVGNNGGTTTYSGILSGSGSLTKIGAGLLTLAGSNKYTGSTAITAGTLQLGTGGAGPDGSINSTSGVADNAAGTLAYNLFGNQTAPYAISGGGSLVKLGGGMLTLSGANTGFTGTTTLSSGTLQVGNVAALGAATAGVVVNGGVLDLHGYNPTIGPLSGGGGTVLTSSAGVTSTLSVNTASGATTYGGALANGAGTLALTTLGNGMLTLAGVNTYSGATTISGGTLAVNGSLGSGSTVNIVGSGALAGAGTIGGNATIAGNGVINLASAGLISGTLTTSGGNWNGQGSVAGAASTVSGLFTVGNGATLTANGGLSVFGGSLLLNGGTLNSGSAVSVASGATFGGLGSAGSANVAAGGIIQPGYSGAGSLDLAALAYSGSGSLNIGPLANYSSSVPVNVGALSVGGSVTISITTIPGAGIYDLISYGTLQGSGTFQTSTLPNRASGQLVNTGSQIDLNVSSIDYVHWTGTQSAAWDTASQNWILNSNGSPTTYINNPGDTVVFDNGAGTNTSVTLTTALFPASVTVASSNNYTFSGSGSIGDSISGPSGLTLAGPGSLTLANTGVNNYTGGTAIQGGTLFLGASNALPTAGTVTFGTSGSNGTLNLSGFNQTVGGLGLGSGATAAGQVITTSTGSPTLTYTGGVSVFYGTIQDTGPGGGVLSLTIAGGTLDVSGGTTTYYGVTTVNGGELLAGNLPNTSSVTVNGGSLFATRFNSSAQLTVASGASATFSGTNLSLTNLSGVSNSGSLTFSATSGAITLFGLAGGGTTTFAAGANITLQDSGGSAAVAGPLSLFQLSGAALTVGGSASINTALSGSATVAGYASIATLTGATLTLNNSATITTASNGAATVAGSATIGSLTGAILTLNGPASITTAASGVANLNGATASIGTLTNPTVNLGNGAALIVTAGSQTTGSITGSGSLTSGPGLLVLANNNTYSGTTTVSGGTLQVGNGGTAGSLSANSAIVDNGTLVYSYAGTTSRATLPTPGISGTGTVSATAENLIVLTGSVITGGSQSYDATINTHTRGTGVEVGGAAPSNATVTLATTAAGSSISLSGDVGQNAAGSPGENLVLSTSAVNGTINLDVSIGYNGNWFSLGSFSANAGTGAINWSGPYGSGSNQTTPVSLTGAITFSSNFLCRTALPMTLNATEPSSVSGVFSGPMSVIAGGPSILTVTNIETYTGSTTISGGTLQLGTGVPGFDGALNGTSSLSNSGALVYDLTSNQTAAYSISGPGSVTMIGSSLLVFSASNTYSGSTAISGGTLELGAGGANGSIGNTSGVTNNGALVYNISSNRTAAYAIAGTGSVGMIGGGLINLAASNSYSGGTYINSGVLQLGNSAALGTGALAANGGTLDLGGFSVTVPSFSGAAGVVLNNGGGVGTLATIQGGSTTFSGSLQDGAGQTALSMNGSGRLTLAGLNTYSGPTMVNAGVLAAGAANAFSPNSPITVNAGVLDATAGPQSVGAISIGSSTTLNLYVGNVLNSSGAASFGLGSTLNISNSAAIVTPDVLMTYLGAATGTFTNVNGLPAADTLFYNSGGSLEIISSGPVAWVQGNGDWSMGTNWSSGSQPNGPGQAAVLNQANSGAVAINLDVPVTIGALQFASSTTSYTVFSLSANTLTFNNNSGGTSQVTVLSGTHSINTAVFLQGGSLDIAASNSSILTIAGNVSDGGNGQSLILDGDGTGELVLGGTNTYTGSTIVNAGTLIVDSPSALLAGSSLLVGGDASTILGPAVAAPALVAGVAAVPEPGTLLLLLAALGSAMACHRFSKRPDKG